MPFICKAVFKLVFWSVWLTFCFPTIIYGLYLMNGYVKYFNSSCCSFSAAITQKLSPSRTLRYRVCSQLCWYKFSHHSLRSKGLSSDLEPLSVFKRKNLSNALLKVCITTSQQHTLRMGLTHLSSVLSSVTEPGASCCKGLSSAFSCDLTALIIIRQKHGPICAGQIL